MFKLEVNPTFKTKVDIPIPGEKAEPVLFTFKHRTRGQFETLVKAIANGEKSIDDVLKELVAEWTYPGVDFSEEALERCFELFPGSPLAIFSAYRDALLEARRKN